MKSWQVFYEARRTLKTKMCAVFGNRNSRTVDYWAQDPNCCADAKRNPIDRLEDLFKELSQNNAREVAKSGLRILANAIDCKVIDRREVVPDKDTLLEEMLDDMPCLIAYQKALLGEDLEEVDRTKSALERELAENRVKFLEERKIKAVCPAPKSPY